MFAYDEETGELTRDGKPVADQLQRVFDLVATHDAEEFSELLERDWEVHDVPGSGELLYLPARRGEFWDEWVEEIANASRSADSFGPMTSDGWQKICRVDDIYFFVNGGDGGLDVQVIGVNARAEALASADGFIEDDYGDPVSIWSDEDDPEPEDLTWYVDGDEDDFDDDPDERALAVEASEWQQRLWATVITHDASGVVLAGSGGSAPLPGPGTWYVVPVPSHRHDDLSSTIAGQPVTVHDNGTTTEALLTQYLGLSAATRLAESFGEEVLWELSADEVRLIRCEPYSVVASALRDMP